MKLKFTGTDKKQFVALRELAEQLGITLSLDGTPVEVSLSDKLSVKKTENGYSVTYSRPVELYRAVSHLVAENEADESSEYTMLCYMADMSRDAVYNIPSAKRMIRYLALMGYDSLMLYTEDTYEVPEYPYFGHMRGRFSKDELRELDDYADMFGIEVIPCIQTLAHLATALRWPGLRAINDVNDIMLVGDENTYKFIDACLKVCVECFRSRRINVGMDEAHALGLGKYLARNGYRPATEIMLEHLDRVVGLCRENGLEPMIWSDMFFRMAFGGQYRVREGEIAKEVMDKVPEGLTVIYWDYYSLDRQIFEHMVDCHLKFNNPVAFAGGAWKWSGFAPHNRFSLASTKMQLEVCSEKKLSNVIVTAWGDNGGEASQFSVLPTMLYFAEYGYCHADPSSEQLEARARACFGIGYEELLTLDAPNELPGIGLDAGRPLNPSRYLLYNDPLEGLLDAHMDPETASEGFMTAAQRLLLLGDHPQFGYMFTALGELSLFLSMKCDLSIRLRKAYAEGDRIELAYIAQENIPEMVEQLDIFIDAFRNQWYTENKTFGFSVQELRLGGLKERLISTADRVLGYLAGEYKSIEELEQPALSYDGRTGEKLVAQPYINNQGWHSTVTAGVL